MINRTVQPTVEVAAASALQRIVVQASEGAAGVQVDSTPSGWHPYSASKANKNAAEQGSISKCSPISVRWTDACPEH